MSSLISSNPSSQEGVCGCSFDTLQIMTDLRNTQTVVDFGVVLDLGYRLYEQGLKVVNCKYCRRSQQSSISTLPVLAKQCLTLFEAACSAYNISRRDRLFDPIAAPLNEPLSEFICIKAKVTLGEVELEGEEAEMLAKMLLNRNLLRLAELLESLKEVLSISLKDDCPPQRTLTLRSCQSSVDTTIHRLAVLVEQIGVESC
uniref:Putative regulatory protein n=1 Tax=Paecilomyces fulvus TaxID=89137 RepID=A0A172WCV7_9EURO|nr:putative regulatory protein [Paecilomyces fulvus]